MLPFLYIKFIYINDFVSTLCLVLLMCLSIPDNFRSVYRLIALPYSLASAGHIRLFVISLALFTLFLLRGMFSFLSLQALKLSLPFPSQPFISLIPNFLSPHFTLRSLYVATDNTLSCLYLCITITLISFYSLDWVLILVPPSHSARHRRSV